MFSNYYLHLIVVEDNIKVLQFLVGHLCCKMYLVHI